VLTDKLHYLNLAAQGTFQAAGPFASAPADVDALFAHLAQQPAPHLVLYFHGGLVSEGDGLREAAHLHTVLTQTPGLHPYFFIWQSGWREVARRNLESIQKEPLFKKLSEAVLRFVVSKLTQTDDTRGGLILDLTPQPVIEAELTDAQPFAAYDPEPQRATLEEVTAREERQLRDYLARDRELQAEVQALAATADADSGRGLAGAPIAPHPTLLSADVLTVLKAEAAEGRGLVSTSALLTLAAKVFVKVVRRLLKRTDHGVYCTTVEELLRALYLDNVGAWLWRGMKTDIQGAFADNTHLSGSALHGGSYLLAGLRAYALDPARPPLKVSLVGHSAGGIYICRLLERAATVLPAGFRFHRVILLAPGCDFELFQANLIERRDRWEQFRLFALRDEFESVDVTVPGLYPRSILYLVSGLLEGDEPKPIVGLQRCYRESAEYAGPARAAVRAFFDGPGAAQVVWGPVEENAAPGALSAADRHTTFDDALTWQSIRHLLTQP
jgi:hypothetical protein